MKIIKSERVTWVDILSPTEKDVKYIKERFFFHPFILKSIVPPFRHPRFENYGNYLFLVLHFPFFDKKTQETKPRELDILITKDTIITIHYNTILPLRELFTRLSLYENERKEFTDQGVGEVLYRLLNKFLKSFFPKLDHIDEKIDEIEEQIFQGKEKEVIKQISTLKHDLINFQRITQPQIVVFEALKETSKEFFGKEFYPYFSELFNCFLNIREVLQNHHQTLIELEQTNSNLLSTKTNEIIKILTIFTVILTPMTLIANIYGMNVSHLPFIGRDNDFWIITGLMITSLLLTFAYIKIKKWL